MYRALVTDLDGTAIPISSYGEDVTAHARATIATAISRGFKLACATGRHWEHAEAVIRSLGFTAPCIVEGGTRIVRAATGETLWEKLLAAEAPELILDTFKTIMPTGIFMSSADHLQHPLDSIATPPRNARFMYLLAVEKSAAATIADLINAQPSTVTHITPSWVGGGLFDVHVTHAQGTKEHAMHVWQEMEGVTPAETIGLGDSGNDIPIFQASGLKVAVGNATPNLKRLADYLAPDVNDEALAHVITKFLLDAAPSKPTDQ